jgi:HlyD family secretion protein
MRISKSLVVGSVVIGIVVAAVPGIVWYDGRSDETPIFRLEKVTQGPLSIMVNTTGTIEPEDVVDVGAQVLGKIQEFGVDPKSSGQPIDYLSEVDAGTTLARIDDSAYRARSERAAALVEQARAQCDQMQVNIQRAQADLVQAKATLQKAERDWKRAQQLRPTNSISDSDHDAAEAAYEVGRADVQIAEASIEQQLRPCGSTRSNR